MTICGSERVGRRGQGRLIGGTRGKQSEIQHWGSWGAGGKDGNIRQRGRPWVDGLKWSTEAVGYLKLENSKFVALSAVYPSEM